MTVTDTVSLESCVVEGLNWSVLYVDNGRGGIFNDDTHESHTFQDLFKMRVWEAADGEVFVGEADSTTPPQSLDVQGVRFAVGKSTIKLGFGTSTADIVVYVFSHPRAHGLKCYWDMIQVYKTLGLTTFSNIPSKWTNDSLEAWLRFLDGVGLSDSACRSTSSQHENTEWRSRCLPSTSVSTAAFFALLTKWGLLARARGGFEEGSCKQVAGTIATTLLRELCVDSAFTIRVHITEKMYSTWPRPAPFHGGNMYFDLVISKELVVDLSGLRAIFVNRDDKAASMFAKQLIASFSLGRLENMVSWSRFVAKAFLCNALKPLASQVLVAIASSLEQRLVKLAKVDCDVVSGDLAFSWVNKDALLQYGYQQGEKIAKYVLSCQDASRGQRSYTLAVDEHSGCGMPLMNGVAVWPNGTAILLVPQALLLGPSQRQGKLHPPTIEKSFEALLLLCCSFLWFAKRVPKSRMARRHMILEMLAPLVNPTPPQGCSVSAAASRIPLYRTIA